MALILVGTACFAGTKSHVIVFGKWTVVQCSALAGSDEKPLTLKVRALIVDGRVKEQVLGVPHEVTDRLFVIRRVFRVNDNLPGESGTRWQWQRGGWLLVDRTTGRVSAINLPEFDPSYSDASWYRDYAAYCGAGEDGRKSYAIVAQLGRRKPILKKALADAPVDEGATEARCPAPLWQRNPIRVSFEPRGSEKMMFAIRGRVVDVVNDSEDEEGN